MRPFSLIPHRTAPASPLRLAVLAVLAAGVFGAPVRAQPGQTTIEVIGDSQAQGLAGALQRKFLRDPQFRVLDRSKIATGILPRPNGDWPRMARTLAAERRVDLAVAMFGANDRPPIRRGNAVDPALRDEFEQSYGERVRQVMRAFRDAGIEVVWVGHPVVRDNFFTEDMALLNHVFERVASEEGVRWVPTWDMFTTADGGYTPYGKGADGVNQRLRADDGVHFTAAGYDVVASRLEPLIAARRAELADPAAAGR